jgi:transmembrane sensor
MNTGNLDSVNELITKYLAGEASIDEEKELSAWVASSAENQRHFNNLKKVFDLTGNHLALHSGENPHIDLDKEWARFESSTGIRKIKIPLSPFQLFLRIAASVLIAAAAAGIFYYYAGARTRVFETAEGKRTIELPDGSKVTLNRNSALSYTGDLSGTARVVALEGEAFFEVKPDASKPFIILTEQSRIQVLGTSFDVIAYDSLQSVEVIVQTGIVSLQPKAGGQQLKLQAGEKGIYSKASGKLANVVNADPNFLSWNTRRLVFVDNDLRSVIGTLEKTYHANITISTDLPPSCIVTVTFDNQTLESVLRVLESTLNLEYTIVGDSVEITAAGC